MTHRLFHHIIFVLTIIVLLPACTSVEKLVDNGNYDEAIRLAHRKLAGKKAPHPKYVTAARDALEAANDRDLRRADRIKFKGESADWASVFRIYREIDRRQEKIRPLLPLVDRHGIKADFRFVRVEPMLAEARDRAAAQAYDRGLQLLDRGRAGDKLAARDAHRAFDDANDLLPNYRNVNRLSEEAEALGIVYVTLDVENRTRAYLPAGFENELLSVNTRGMDSRWRRFHLQPQSGFEYDYRAKIVIGDIQVSPERVQERAYVDEKEITDGREYVLDENGNVAKDTLGNDITVPRKVTIRAEVLEIYQSKVAAVTGELILFEARSGRQLDRRALTGEALFENYASTFSGDRRALSSETRRRLGNRPGPFPSDERLILDAADRLKPILQEELAESFQLI